MRMAWLVVALFSATAMGQAKTLPSVACRLDGGSGCGPGGAGSGTVTSVGSGTIGPLFSVSWATPTTTPAFSLDLVAQAANCVVAGPSSGGNAVPTCRSLVAGDIPSLSSVYQPLDSDLTAVAALSSNGLIARTGSGTAAVRTITGTTNETAITNGDGVSGNPTIGLASTIDLSSKTAVILKVGALSSIPATCTVGAVYVASDQTPGRNLYLCTSTNTWSLQGGQFPAVVSEASNATPSINCTVTDVYKLTAQAADITSVTITGTPAEEQLLRFSITGTASRAITWGSSFESSTSTLPTTTSGTARLDVLFVWNAATSKWRCLAVA